MIALILFLAVISLSSKVEAAWYNTTYNFSSVLIAYYDFNESVATYNLTDIGTGAYNLTAVGAVNISNGIIGNSRGPYSAIDYFHPGTSITLDQTKAMTLNMWVNLTSSADHQAIYCTGGGSGVFRSYLHFASDTKNINLAFDKDTTAGYSCSVGGYFNNASNLNRWIMITVVWNTNKSFFLYLDGQLSCGGNYAQSSSSTLAALHIGEWYSGDQWPATKSRIDEFSVFSSSLNATQIAELWQNGKGLQFQPNAPASEVIVPNITSIVLSPSILYDSSVLNCNITIRGSSSTYDVQMSFYNSTQTLDSRTILGVANNTNTYLWNLTFLQTNIGDTIYCNASANDTGATSSIKNTSKLITGVAFTSAQPPDLTIFNLIPAVYLNTSYKFYSSTGYANNTILIFAKTNTSTSDDSYYYNGTTVTGYYTNKYAINNSENYTFRLSENGVYRGTYNTLLAETGPHEIVTIGSNPELVGQNILNVSNSTQYNVLEFMVNSTAGSTSALTIRYCNDSFTMTNGNNPKTSPNCGICGSLAANTGFGHIHSNVSAHNNLTLPVDIVAGTMCGIRTTKNSTFFFSSTSPNSYDVHYIVGLFRVGIFGYTANNGGSWVKTSDTVDMHLHQYTNDSVHYEYACFNDTAGIQVCSSVRLDAIDLISLPPTSPIVNTPTTGTYGSRIYINWTASTSFTGSIFSYNITLTNSSTSQIYTISNNSPTNLSSSFCAKDFNNKTDIYAQVRANTNDSQTSFGLSSNFSTDYRTQVGAGPSSGAFTYPVNITCLFYKSTDDMVLSTYLCYNNSWGYNNNCTLTKTITGPGDTYYNLNTTVTAEGDYTFSCRILPTDCINNLQSANQSFSIDGIPPVINILQPLSTDLFAYETIGPNYIYVNMTITDAHIDQCWKNYTTDAGASIVVRNCSSTDSIGFTMPADAGVVRLNVSANDTGGLTNSEIRTWAIGYMPNNLTAGQVFNSDFSINMNSSASFGPTYTTGTCIVAANKTCSVEVLGSCVIPFMSCNTSTYTLGSPTILKCSPSKESTDANVEMWVSCDIDGAIFNSTRKAVWVDVVAPIIYGRRFDQENRSVRQQTNITGQFNISDSNLFRLNVSIDNTSISNIFMNTTEYIYNLSQSMAGFPLGRHILRVRAYDSHTAQAISNYKTSEPIFSNTIHYDTGTNKIDIEAADEPFQLANPFTTTKLSDRYTFDYAPSDTAKSSYTFNVHTDQQLYIINKPNSKWQTWIVSGNNWIDFYSESMPNNVVDIQQIDDNNAMVTVSLMKAPEPAPPQVGKDGKIIILPAPDATPVPITLADVQEDGILRFSSIGDLNMRELNYTFYTHNVTITYSSPVRETERQTILVNLTLSTPIVIYPPNYAFALIYGNLSESYVTSGDTTNTFQFNVTFYTPNVGNSVQNITVYLNYSGTNDVITFNQTVVHINFTNCDINATTRALTICGYNETSFQQPSILDLNANFDLWINDVSATTNMHFGLNSSNCYYFCIEPNTTKYNVFATLEYGSGDFTKKKYYIYNMLLNATNPQNVSLYELDTYYAQPTLFTIYDRQTGKPVSAAYIKVLRYYPELNQYNTVEIEKTNENGQAICKLVLYDVFYSFEVDYPYTTVRLITPVAKLSSTTQSIGIPLSTDLMAEFAHNLDTLSNVTCDASTDTCYIRWISLSGASKSATLEIYEDSGLYQTLIYTNTSSVPSASGVLYYTIPNIKNNTRYIAKGYITASDSIFVGIAQLFKQINIFTSNSNLRIGSLIPLILLTIAFVCALLDIGVVGVVIGSLSGIVLGMATTIIPMNLPGLISLVLLGVILIWKMVK